jgi:phage shock protein A
MVIDRIRRNGPSAAFEPGSLPGMAQPPDLEARVAALENRVEELTQRVHRSEHDAAAARVLAGGADRDVEQIRGEIRDFKQATTASFNAMREDINDLRTEIRAGFADVDRGFADMRGRLDATAAGIEQIANMLGRGEHRPDGPA